jgi:Gas vesicle synthesis protein GvpL/GvpF
MSSGLCVYAIVGSADLGAPLGRGLAEEPLRLVGGGTVRAIAGEPPQPPRPDPGSLRAHDAVVRRLAGAAPALLPARFGQRLPDEASLIGWLAVHARELSAALDRVAGCVQMTLRIFSGPAGPEAMQTGEPPPAAPGGPGASYLEQRRRELRWISSLPEIAPLRDALRPLLRHERIERAPASGRLHATAYDLIAAGAVREYSRIVHECSPRLAGWRIKASGPWPPYAFAPKAVA